MRLNGITLQKEIIQMAKVVIIQMYHTNHKKKNPYIKQASSSNCIIYTTAKSQASVINKLNLLNVFQSAIKYITLPIHMYIIDILIRFVASIKGRGCRMQIEEA